MPLRLGKVVLCSTINLGPLSLTTPMKLSELIAICTASLTEHGDMPVILAREGSILEEGFENSFIDGITDIRLTHDWPLPGKSLMVAEPIKSQLLILYDSLCTLDSSISE